MQRDDRARLFGVQLMPHAVVVGDDEGVARFARLAERAVDLDRHRELPEEHQQARTFALEWIGLVQRDEQAVRARAQKSALAFSQPLKPKA